MFHWERAGVIKAVCPVLFVRQLDESLAAIEAEAAQFAGPLILMGRDLDAC